MPVPGFIVGLGAVARVAGGILGKGGKNVNPLYNRPVVSNVKVKPAGPRGVSQTKEALSKVKPVVTTPKGPNVKVVKSQAQINAEGVANARVALGLPPKPTAQELASRSSKEKISLMKSRIKKGK